MSSLPGRCRNQNRNGHFRFFWVPLHTLIHKKTGPSGFTLTFTKKAGPPGFSTNPASRKLLSAPKHLQGHVPSILNFEGHVPRASMSQERACPVPSILKACPNSGPVPTILKGLSQDRACRSHDNVQNSTANRSARGHGGASAILVAMRRNTFEITI